MITAVFIDEAGTRRYLYDHYFKSLFPVSDSFSLSKGASAMSIIAILTALQAEITAAGHPVLAALLGIIIQHLKAGGVAATLTPAIDKKFTAKFGGNTP